MVFTQVGPELSKVPELLEIPPQLFVSVFTSTQTGSGIQRMLSCLIGMAFGLLCLMMLGNASTADTT